jgi:hypothetical protein
MTKLRVNLDEVAGALEDGSYENSYFLDIDTGAVILMIEETRSNLEQVLRPGVNSEDELRRVLEAGTLPEWQNADVIAAYRILESRRECYLEIPSIGAHAVRSDMHAFVATVADPDLRSTLEQSLRGRGAERRFKDVIWQHEAESFRWNEHHRERARGRALEWLAAEGIEVAGTVDEATGQVVPFPAMLPEPEYQLRIYDIVPGRMEEFVVLFGRIAEIRRSLGFDVLGPWVDADSDQFVWIAGYRGPQGFEAASRAYRESPERSGLMPDPSVFITSIETRMLRPI